MTAIYESRQTRVGYAEQASFATAVADGDAMEEITCDPMKVDPDIMIHELTQNHGTREPVDQNTVHSVQGSSAKFSIAGPVDLNDLDQFAYGHFQKVIELADTEFTKTFTYFTDHPDFSADEGHFLTFVNRLPGASTSQKVKSCIAPRFKLSAARDEMLMFETDWVGLGTSDDTANPSGTWTPRDGTDFLYFNNIASATLTKGASLASPVALTMQSFECEGAYEVDKIGHDATNGFEQHGMKTRSGTFKIDMLRDATADEAISSMKTGELVQFDVDFGLLTISISGKIEALEYADDGILVNSITCRMASSYTAGSVGNSLTVVIQNTVDRGWPAA